MKEKAVLKTSIIQGFGTLIAREFFMKMFSFVGQLLLARLLFPSDFGIYAILSFIISFFGLFTDIGLSLAVIQQKENPSKRELSHIFTLRIFLTITLIILIWLVAPFISNIYSFTNEHIFMLRIFSITLLFSSIRALSIALLEREIKYNTISKIDIFGVAIYYISAFLCAITDYGVWSFIIAALCKEILETFLLYVIKPFPRLTVIAFNDIKHLLKFGVFIQGNGIVSFLNSSIAPLIGGVFSTSHAVGVLDFANNIASIPETIAINFGRVAFTSYSRIQEQKELLIQTIRKSVIMLSMILFIFPILIFSFGKDLIHLIYTEKWIEAVPALYWFSATTFFQPIIASLGQGILAIGKSREIFIVTLYTTLLGWILAYILVTTFGFNGIAATSFFISMTLCISYLYIFHKHKFSFSIITTMFPLFLVVVIVSVSAAILNMLLASDVIYLIIKIIITCLIYGVSLFVILKNDVRELLSITQVWLQKRKK